MDKPICSPSVFDDFHSFSVVPIGVPCAPREQTLFQMHALRLVGQECYRLTPVGQERFDLWVKQSCDAQKNWSVTRNSSMILCVWGSDSPATRHKCTTCCNPWMRS